MKQLHGPELGYNNLLDFSAALGLLLEFERPGGGRDQAHQPVRRRRWGRRSARRCARAKASDPVSIYGGIVGVNRTLDMTVVQELAGIFVEILFAPAYAPDALEELRRTKKKCRVFELPCDADRIARAPGRVSQRAGRACSSQATDLVDLDPAALKTVTRRAPTAAEMTALRFAWRVGKHVKSNAIVLTHAPTRSSGSARAR